MIDPRWEHLASILLNYSTRTQRGNKIVIMMMEVETLPLVQAIYTEAIKLGAFPQVQFNSAWLERPLLLYGNSEQLDWVTEQEAHGMDWADVYIGLRGARNPFEFADIPPQRLAAHKRAMGKISAMRTEKTRWVLMRVPNEAFAQQAEMPFESMMQFFFNATLKDWGTEVKRYEELKQVFQDATTVRIVGRDTDIRFSTKGRIYEIGDGRYNMPDGEIYTSPVDDSVEGRIYFEFPGVYAGNKINDICLEFKEGRVVNASSSNNTELLLKLLDMDGGSRRLGEFGVGVNFGIDRFCYDILYDEKIGGTIHLALGRAFADCGGVNQSALHWDIIKDLRSEGAVYLNDRKVMEQGQFLMG